MTRTAFKTVKGVLPSEPSKAPMPKVKPTKGVRPPLLAFRRSKTGNLLAAYRVDIRVGYVCHSPSTRPGSKAPPYTWELSLMRPEGGHYVGRAETEVDAQIALTSAFTAWLGHAQLKEM